MVMEQSEKIEKIDDLFSELDEFGRIEAMSKLSRIRNEPTTYRGSYNPESYHATIPAPDRAPHYGRGFVNVSLRVILWTKEGDEEKYKTVFKLTCIDDGCWDAHGPIESFEKARDRCQNALEILRDYEERREWFTFEELKEDFQSCGLYLRI